MGKMINSNGELLRIDGDEILYSEDKGKHWRSQSTISSKAGIPQDLTDGETEILLLTNKKILYSEDMGKHWYERYKL